MKKYFLTLIITVIPLIAMDSDYFSVISDDVNTEVIEMEETIDIYEADHPTESCRELPKPVDKPLASPKDIKIFTTKTIKPINYTNTVSLNKLHVTEKKQKFFHMILPAILISKQKLKAKRNRVKEIMTQDNPSVEDIAFLEELYKTYKTENNKELLSRMQTHPVSIILAQAAIESAWGESRFFKEGNNIFGMWSYNKNEPRIRAKGTRNGKAIFVRKYETLSDAIDHYFEVIGRGAYKSFRKQRNITDDPLKLVEYLVNYCELREQYTRKLKKFIIANKLKKFDEFKLDRTYLTQNL